MSDKELTAMSRRAEEGFERWLCRNNSITKEIRDILCDIFSAGYELGLEDGRKGEKNDNNGRA